MYITVNQLANKINNLEHFTMQEIQENNKIIKIIVEITNNGKTINYYVDTKAKRECYTEQNIPCSIVRMMNYSRPVYHEKTETTETIVYSFD